jgi:hypothetical protein
MSLKRIFTKVHFSLLRGSLLLLNLLGCSQIGALTGNPTEELREWVRQDADRKKLIVFVHGFNSSRRAAWGHFPDFTKNDPNFDEYNIHLFGYPTQVCRQVNDIRDEGEFLASFLKETMPGYESVLLVGHSMGGLVILHALLTLERSDFVLVKDANIKILTFGPYEGVDNANLLTLLCENAHAKDMVLLNKHSHRLQTEWKGRFNRTVEEAGRETPQIPIYAFRGDQDHFVTEASACGAIVT